jgi:DNA repair exonuclease SbcCD ATPase subunit
MSVKINQLELENVKRIKAVKIELTENGLTVIGGRNNQGKTSVLDSIAWALGGDRYKPSQPKREGSVTPPNLKVTLSNGLIVERKGKNSSLKVTDPDGNKSGQQVLNSFIEELSLNLPKFMNSTSQEKARTLLKIIGVGDQLFELEKQEKECYNERHSIGQIADRKKKFAEEQPYYQGVPNELVSASELIKQQQEILARNGENARKREKVNQYEYQVSSLTDEVSRIRQQLQIKEEQLNEATTNLSIAKTDAMDLHDESTAELESNIQKIDEINRKVRANMDKEKAEEDAREYERQYQELTEKVEKLRTQKMDLLQNANLPLPDLSVENNEITYRGQKWDNMSGSDQLKVATAIVRKLNPQCGFVLVDKLEQMDQITLAEFGKWLEEQDLQAIGTRVSTGDECSIIIEDGYVKGQNDIKSMFKEEINDTPVLQNTVNKVWEPGKF